MKKVILVDSNSLLYRSYYALPNLSTKDGFPTGGSMVFCALCQNYSLKLTAILSLWAMPKGLGSQLGFKEYKTNRPKAPDELSLQREKLPDILAHSLYHTLCMKGKKLMIPSPH